MPEFVLLFDLLVRVLDTRCMLSLAIMHSKLNRRNPLF